MSHISFFYCALPYFIVRFKAFNGAETAADLNLFVYKDTAVLKMHLARSGSLFQVSLILYFVEPEIHHKFGLVRHFGRKGRSSVTNIVASRKYHEGFYQQASQLYKN
jgi:hypothetical protein